VEFAAQSHHRWHATRGGGNIWQLFGKGCWDKLSSAGEKFFMTTRTRIAAYAAIASAVVTLIAILRPQSSQKSARVEGEVLQQQDAAADNGNQKAAETVPPLAHSDSVSESPSSELLRLRGEVGVLRRQADDLKASLAQAQQQTQQAGRVQDLRSPLPEEYPKTPQAATTGIFQTLVQGDFERFASNFGEPGVPKESYDKLFGADRVKTYLAQIESVTVGEPTNSFGPNLWFVPYKLRFKDGSEKDMRLHVGQDPQSQKWYLKGGI
jgi:hypothetical protein